MNRIGKWPKGVGKKIFKIIACLTFLVFSVFQSHSIFAAEGVASVTISVNEQGETIIIADSEVLNVVAGDGWRNFTLSSGEKIAVFIDPDTDATSIKCYTGTVQVVAENTTTTVPEGSTMTASVDTETGAATVIAVTGTVEVTSEGQIVLVRQGEVTTASPGKAPSPPASPKPPKHKPKPPKPHRPPPKPPHSPFS
ncbi:MAG: hypothetical protein U9N19_04380 [Thermodesulfobacteriota bacterium]|nr:hypothetical protein [Thermodesulfobacteriota bacterium]